jgi:hypothetical protein
MHETAMVPPATGQTKTNDFIQTATKRVHELRERLGVARGRLQDVADGLYGPAEPQVRSGGPVGREVPQTGSTAELDDVLNGLSNDLDELTSQVARLSGD